MYQIDLKKVALSLIPPHRRRKPLIQVVYSAIAGIKNVLSSLYEFEADLNYDLQFNAQVIYFEHVLNDQFDEITRLIYIENLYPEKEYVFNKVENRPPVYVFNKAENEAPFYIENLEDYDYSFNYLIHCPVGISAQIDEIIELVEAYNLAGMTYQIVFDII